MTNRGGDGSGEKQGWWLNSAGSSGICPLSERAVALDDRSEQRERWSCVTAKKQWENQRQLPHKALVLANWEKEEMKSLTAATHTTAVKRRKQRSNPRFVQPRGRGLPHPEKPEGGISTERRHDWSLHLQLGCKLGCRKSVSKWRCKLKVIGADEQIVTKKRRFRKWVKAEDLSGRGGEEVHYRKIRLHFYQP